MFANVIQFAPDESRAQLALTLVDTRAPAVVAVVVTTGSGPGLEATIASLVAQDYENLSILVMANGDAPEVVDRVAVVAPNTFVKVQETNLGFAAACNEAASMVSGATFMVFCHDDVRLQTSCVSQMVEAAFRQNAGIVTPKIVDYDDSLILVHVGQVADRFGSVRERIELGEIDHGQQDLERDVFVAPGGVTLVRADLFAALRGFDPLIPALGEDLNFCWRAQIAGARIVVAPQAVAAHRQSLARGEREVQAATTRGRSRQDLQRRHQLWTALSCWGVRELALTVFLWLVLDVVELVVALISRDSDRFGAIMGSWRFAWRHRQQLRTRRAEIETTRVLDDEDIRRLQVGGSSRVRRFVENLVYDGIDRAIGVLPPHEAEIDLSGDTAVGFGASFSEDESFDDVGSTRQFSLLQLFQNFRSQAVLVGAAIVVWVIGTHNLVATHLPTVGRLAPLDSWWTTWHHFFASWSPTGVGSGAPGMPGYAVLGAAGTVVFGRMGILPRTALIFAIPVGAYGIWRLLRGVLSNRARIIAAISYGLLPVCLNLISGGRLDVLSVAAILPFALRRVGAILEWEPFRGEEFVRDSHFGQRSFIHSRGGQILILVIQVAVATAMDPAALLVALLAIGAVAFSARFGVIRSGGYSPLRLAVRVTVAVALLLAPLTADTVLAGSRAASVFGQPTSSDGLSLSHVLSLADGAFGPSLWRYLMVAIAAVGVIASRGPRRSVAEVGVALYAISVLLIVLASHHLMGSFAPDVATLMTAGAVGLAMCVGAAVAALENDIRGTSFGWRQVIAAGTVVCLPLTVVGIVPALSTGRFELPLTGSPDSLASYTPSASGYRVLWIGDPRSLPIAGWSVAPGVSIATSTNSVPGGSTLFAPPLTGAMDVVLRDVADLAAGRSVVVGRDLAIAGISTIVVMNSPAPRIADLQNAPLYEVPAALMDSLAQQRDIAQVSRSGGVTIWKNTAYYGLVASIATPLSTARQLVPGQQIDGTPQNLTWGVESPLSGSTFLVPLAPSSAWSLEVKGHPLARRTVLGWVGQYERSGHSSGPATLVLHQVPLNAIFALATLLLWGVIGLGFGQVERLEVLIRARRTVRNR